MLGRDPVHCTISGFHVCVLFLNYFWRAVLRGPEILSQLVGMAQGKDRRMGAPVLGLLGVPGSRDGPSVVV